MLESLYGRVSLDLNMMINVSWVMIPVVIL